jgi:tRNA threonylcarbamoyladenosine biosynthesis protein TsaB
VGQGLSRTESIAADSILALDAATSTVVVGVASKGGQVLSERRLEGGRGDVVPGMVASLLEELGIGAGAIGSVVCGVGPGSFTGIRIALSFAHGFAFRRDLALAGASSLASALQHPSLPTDRPRVALLDALRGEVYCRRLEAGDASRAGSDIRVPLARLPEILTGSAVVLAEGRKDFLEALPKGWLALSGFVRAQGLVDLRGKAVQPLPNYLRASAPEELWAQGLGPD